MTIIGTCKCGNEITTADSWALDANGDVMCIECSLGYDFTEEQEVAA